MAQDFSYEPFFDDYSEDSNFYRVLFRPGYAVQARELTQLQTILQEQIRRHGDHIFKEGAMVIPGQVGYDLNLSYVQIETNNNVDMTFVLDQLVGKAIKNSSNLQAQVITYTKAEEVTVGGQTVSHPYTIFVKYLNSVRDQAGNNVQEYDPAQVLTPVDGSSGLELTVSDVVVPNTPPIGKGCSASIQRGIFYINKNFVLVKEQLIILDKYSNTPSYRVGLKLQETIVYPEDDESLLDNALGSPNFAAPGAARYKIDLTLVKIPFLSNESTVEQEEGFIDILRIRDGVVQFKLDRTAYAELEKTLARRTYDESGDYTLAPFPIQVKNYRNNLRGDWAPGEKFIQGDLIRVPRGSSDISGFIYFVATTNGVSGTNRPNFGGFASVDNFVDNQITWEYQIFPNFNGGVYTFTAGDSQYSQFTLNDHIRLDGTLCYAVEPSKAYVRGYEIEKIATEYLESNKSRYLPAGSAALCEYFGVTSLPEITNALSTYKTTSIDMSMGSYIDVNNVIYLPDLLTLPRVELHSVTRQNGPSTNTIIGYARIRGIENTGEAPGTYKLFLFDISMNVGKQFSAVKCVFNLGRSTTGFACNSVLANNQTILQNPDSTGLLWRLPDYAIEDIEEVSYTVVAPITANASGGKLELNAPGGYTYESINDPDNYIICDNSTGAIVTNATLSLSGATLTIDGVANQSHTVLAALRRSDATNAQARRTLTDASAIQLKTQALAQQQTITLNHSYVTRIVSVMMSNATVNQWGENVTPVYSVNITNRYTFNFAQDSSGVYLASLTRTGPAPTGPIIIKYEYLSFVTNTPGDFYAVNSYTHENSRIRYDQIPTVASFPLRDTLDFRPIQVTDGTFSARYFPKFGTTGSFKYRHHLSRLDNIALSSEGNYVVSQGVPSEAPNEPSTPVNAMKLAQISIEPYTFQRSDSLGAVINRIENKRYTMRDVGKLERRIEDLEYYTSLTLTEVDTKNLRIIDSQGLDRFQNGFLVDTFDGQGVGNSASDDWNCSIDMQNKELRPFFDQKQVTLVEKVDSTFAQAAATSRYKVSGDLVTLPFTETVMIEQRKASITENVNPYALYSWKGIVDINPWSDTWFSTRYRPDIILNDESQYNAIVAKANADGILGTVWNSWQVAFSSTRSLGSRLENLGKWSTANTEILSSSNNGGTFWRDRATFTIEELDFIGNTDRNIFSSQANSVAGSRVLTIETTAVETTASRSGTRSFVVDKVDSRVLEDRVVDTRVVPFIRPRAVLFTGYGFKPNTKLNAFFDNINVNEYVRGATRLEVIRASIGTSTTTFYPHTFDVTRNAGSAVSTDPARRVLAAEGPDLSGTVTLVNGSTTVESIDALPNSDSPTSFTTEVVVDDDLIFGDGKVYKITAIISDTKLTITPPYTGPSSSNVAVRCRSARFVNEKVEIAFNHGEVIKEYIGSTPTGNTAVVVGQERVNDKYYLYVLNIKGSGNFSTSSNSYLEGEYTTAAQPTKSRVKFVARTDYTSLQSSDTGILCGVFNIPSSPLLKFRTGQRELSFSDSSSNVVAVRNSTQSTEGSAIYEAQGLIEIKQRTIVATRTAQVVSEQVSENNTIVTTNERVRRDTGWFDPLAQTFLVQQEGGAFITSVDIFFQTADERVPVRVEIREVVNGYPGSTVLPFSRVEKKGGDVIEDLEGGGRFPTRFNFVSPVFLQNGVEYALVILSDSNKYRVWISQTDTVDVISQTRITSQPYNGVLFKSQNGTAWTADQTQDLKFVIYRAEFSQAPMSIELIPPALGFADLGFNPLNFVQGERRCRVEHRNHGMITGEQVILKCRQIVNSINNIPASVIFNTPYTILSAELDSYVIEFPSPWVSNSTGRAGGAYISASENYEFTTAMIDIANVVPEGTSIEYQAKVINHADQISTHKIVVRENFSFDEVKVYPSAVNYTNSAFPSGLSIIATLRPSTLTRSLSPVIDLGRMAMTMVSNKIDSPSLDINDVELDYFTIIPESNAIELGDGKPIDLIDANGDGTLDTIVINSTSQATLFNNMNNELNTGDVLRFTYSNIVNPIRDMIIVEKSLDGEGNLYFLLEGFNGEILQETTTGVTVSIQWLSHFKSEYAPIGGSTTSKYVTKKVNFSRPSELLKIMFDAVIPNDAEVEIYYKTGIGVADDFIASRYYKAIPNSYTKNKTEFRLVEAIVEDLQPFDSVMVKLVMKSINKSQVPRIKNLRVIACAA